MYTTSNQFFSSVTKHVNLSPLGLVMFRVQKPKLENLTKACDEGNDGRKKETEEKSSPDGSFNFIHHFSLSNKSICLYHTETWNWSQWPIFWGFPHSLWHEAFDFNNVPLLSLCNGPFSLLTRWMKTNWRVRRSLTEVIGKKILPHSERRRILFYGDIMT